MVCVVCFERNVVVFRYVTGKRERTRERERERMKLCVCVCIIALSSVTCTCVYVSLCNECISIHTSFTHVCL